ncbi:aminodeoxychorismate synthase component I [Dyella tabacisoli]
MSKTLLIDNYDSFTYNLAQLIAKATGQQPVIVRNNETSWDALSDQGYDRIVISPGPGRPQCSDDLGLSADVIVHATVPILGVCLGHQAIGHFFGATVGLAPEPIHGRQSNVKHGGNDLFEGIPSPFKATRYHSLTVTDLPPELEPTAWAEDGTLMALRHISRPIWGVQFHPESICTEHGERLIQNFFTLSAPDCKSAEDGAAQHHAATRPRERNGWIKWNNMRVHTRRCPGKLAPQDAFQALFGNGDKAFWLDSSRPNDTNARFSYFGDASGPYSEVLEYFSAKRKLKIHTRDHETQSAEDIFTYLERELTARRQSALQDCPFDFNGGYVGYFGYELKGELQGDHAHVSVTPDACWIFADRVLVYDHHEHEYWLLCLDAADGISAENLAWLENVHFTLSGMVRVPVSTSEPQPARLHNMRWRHSPEKYLDMIQRSKELIRQGETYEVCLTNELTAELVAEPLPIYMHLRTINAVPFGAYLRFGALSVLCASPELYIEVSRDGLVESKPIKGTAPRHQDPAEDQRVAEKLAGSVKDRSENLMIVDLLRNDLNRCCEVGSVHVPKIFQIESFATVHQLVSTIRGKLTSERSTVDCVRESFPGGSMTGAPKVRTMSILDQLEEGARGIYSGSLGYLALDGSAKLNIVIRTIVMAGTRVSIGAGGAIVALSDPEEELAEVMLKARAQIRVLQSAGIEAESMHAQIEPAKAADAMVAAK